MSELKNCPHCNKVMTEDNFYSEDGYPQGCHCWEDCNTSEKAKEIWNTRPIEAALELENKRLTELISSLMLEKGELFHKLKEVQKHDPFNAWNDPKDVF